MAVDVKDLKVGDEVLVRAKVVACHAADVDVEIEGVTHNALYGAAIAQHIPRKIGVGDECFDGSVRVRVVAIDGDLAWVKHPDGNYTARLAYLERVAS